MRLQRVIKIEWARSIGARSVPYVSSGNTFSLERKRRLKYRVSFSNAPQIESPIEKICKIYAVGSLIRWEEFPNDFLLTIHVRTYVRTFLIFFLPLFHDRLPARFNGVGRTRSLFCGASGTHDPPPSRWMISSVTYAERRKDEVSEMERKR